MKDRFRTAAVLLPLLGVLIWFDVKETSSYSTVILLCLILLGALWEAVALIKKVPRNHRVLYGGLLVSWILLSSACLLIVRHRLEGLSVLLFGVLIAKMTDNGGLFVGSWMGKHTFAPSISPSKTVEGLIGGLVCAVVLAAAGGRVLLGLPIPWGAGLGLLLGGGAIAGDLFESFLKRQAGVKDSGNLLPGLGGILDVMDSIYGIAPLLFMVPVGT